MPVIIQPGLRNDMHRDRISSRGMGAFIYVALVLVAGYCIAFSGRDGLQINADSFAGLTLAQSIDSISNISSAKFARIPSFLSDLIILRIIPSNASVLDSYQIFAIATGTLFILSGSELIYIASSRLIGRISCLGMVTLAALLFARYSPVYRNSLGILLSPIHHGGNIIITVASGLVYLRLQEKCRAKGLFAVIFTAMVIAGTLSNRLFIFTSLIPLALTELVSWKDLPEEKGLRLLNRYRRRFIPIVSAMILSLTLIYVGYSYLEVQCAPKVDWNLGWTITSSLNFMWVHPSMCGAYLSSLVFIIPKTRRLIAGFLSKNKQRSPQPNQRLWLSGMTYLSLASVSWGIYLFLLGKQDLFHPRYVISGILFVPFILVLAISPMLIAFTPIKIRGRSLSSTTFIGATLISFLSGGYSSHYLVLLDSIAIRSAGKHRPPSELLRSDGASVIFSPFWDVEVGIFLERDAAVLPVGSDGLPDLWAHGKPLFQKAIMKLQASDDPVFFYSSSPYPPSNLIRAWGVPDSISPRDMKTRGGMSSQEFQILKYTDAFKKRKILSYLSRKLDSYSQNCDRRSTLFMER